MSSNIWRCMKANRLLESVRQYKGFRGMSIKAALIDLSGTLHIEDEPTPNAIEALKTLRDTGILVKFVTNTTKESSTTLYNRLCRIGFVLNKDEIYSSLSAAAKYVRNNNLNPFYILSEDAKSDFPENTSSELYDSVVVGLAPGSFNYETLNKAFNVLLNNKSSQLIAIHQGKYYKRSDGLALGPGCFIKGLEYSAGAKAILIGKPNKYFFENAIPEGIQPSECVMIGEDINDDIMGAMSVGLLGVQVKTGKYLADVKSDVPPSAVVENFCEAVDWIKQRI